MSATNQIILPMAHKSMTGFIRKHWPAVLFLILGFLVYGLRTVDYFNSVPGDLGDARFNSVILEHLFQWVSGRDVRLWSPAFFYPFEGVLAFSDNHFGSAFLYAISRSLGAGREVSYDFWFLAGIALNFICTYVVIRRLGLSGFAAAAGAFAFAFALPVLSKEGHAQLTYRFAIPLAYSAFLDVLSTKRLFFLWRIVFWAAVQFYCSIYLGIFLGYLLIVSYFAYLFLNRGAGLFSELRNSVSSEPIRNMVFFFVAVSISIAAIIWLLYSYHAFSAIYGFKRSANEISTMLPRLSSYLIADRSALSSWVGRSVTDIPMRHEHQLFLGIGVWFLTLYGAVSVWRNRLYESYGKLATFALAMLFLLTLSLGDLSLYGVIAHLPGLNAVRAVTRIVLVMMMPVAILIAIGSQYLLNRAGDIANAKRIALQSLILVLLTAEVTGYRPYSTAIEAWANQQAAIRKKLPPHLATNAILYVTGKRSDPQYKTELDGMIFAQDLGYPTLNGYSGNTPPNYNYQDPLRNRINSYMSFSRKPLAIADALATRVVLIDLEASDSEPAIATSKIVSSSLARNISLTIDNMHTENHQLMSRLVILNNSAEKLDTLSSIGKPWGVSWRFIHETAAPNDMNANWDPRIGLSRSIPSGSATEIDLVAPLPKTPGHYLFQVSIVQDGVAWLHDLGMKVASVPVTVDTSK